MKFEIKVVELRSLRAKTLGMIGKNKTSNIYFRTRFGIHTLGLHSSIDILVCDESFCVMKITAALPPMRLFFWDWRYANIIELPAGEVKKRGILPGSYIKLKKLQTI
jgi:uncharacterized membrane protein (UPF0127 family)